MTDSRSLTELLDELEGVEWYHSCLPGFLLSPLMEVARAAQATCAYTLADMHDEDGYCALNGGRGCLACMAQDDLGKPLIALRDAIALHLEEK